MSKLAFLLIAYMASGVLANKPTACASITDCAFNEQCVDSICVEGIPALSYGPTPKNPIVTCTDDDCRLADNLIDNSNLRVNGKVYSPGYGPQQNFDGWDVSGTWGVTWSPLEAPPGRGVKKNEVSIRDLYGNDGAFAVVVQIERAGDHVLQFQMADPKGRGWCKLEPHLQLYVDVTNQATQHYHVIQGQQPTRKTFRFWVAAPGVHRISFRGLKQTRDCCSASIRNVQLYRKRR